MLNKLLLICLFFMVSMIGCQKSRHTLDFPSPPRHSLKIEGEVKLRGEVSWVDSTGELKTKVWVVNSGSDIAAIETGPCAFNVLTYTPAEDAKELVWHNRMPELAPYGTIVGVYLSG